MRKHLLFIAPKRVKPDLQEFVSARMTNAVTTFSECPRKMNVTKQTTLSSVSPRYMRIELYTRKKLYLCMSVISLWRMARVLSLLAFSQPYYLITRMPWSVSFVRSTCSLLTIAIL